MSEPPDPDLEADLKAAREILARIRAGEPTIPWEEVKAKLGLDDLLTTHRGRRRVKDQDEE